MKLLVVDDAEDARVLQSTILKSQGYEVATAENGLEALESIKQSRPDLIITDILMPEMDGYELCRRIKTDDQLKDIPVVFYSAHYLDPKDKQMVTDLGGTRLIQKPIETGEFLHIIGDILTAAKEHPVEQITAALVKPDSTLKEEHEQRLTEMLYSKLEQLEESKSMLKRALEGTIATVAMAVEVRDPYTSGHQRRAAQLAEAIALEMGLDTVQVEGIRMGATIHDIGKIQLPAEILSKPGKLSEIEYAIVKGHAQVGYEILRSVEFPWPIAVMVHQHHERMDGSGYPQGLKGDEICLEARILAVADVVEAMVSHRPYRPAYKVEDGLDEISKNRGALYDPDVVDACLKLFSDDKFTFKTA